MYTILYTECMYDSSGNEEIEASEDSELSPRKSIICGEGTSDEECAEPSRVTFRQHYYYYYYYYYYHYYYYYYYYYY